MLCVTSIAALPSSAIHAFVVLCITSCMLAYMFHIWCLITFHVILFVLQRVQDYYQGVNSDPPVDIQLSSFSSTIKPKLTEVDGWTVNLDVKHKEVSKE